MALSIDSMYASLANSASNSMMGVSSGSSLNGLNKSSELKDKIENASSDEELLNACKSFEAYFLEQMFKSMDATVDREEEEGEYTSMFKDNMYEAYANNAVETQGYGIAQMLFESMKRNQTATTTEAAADTTVNAAENTQA